jgi:hypothetical protein
MVPRVPILSYPGLYDYSIKYGIKLSAPSASLYNRRPVYVGACYFASAKAENRNLQAEICSHISVETNWAPDMSNSDLRPRYAKPRQQCMAITSAERRSPFGIEAV